jgi:AraC-like DNA-binding protein
VARLERAGNRPDYRRLAAEAGMSVPTLRRRFHAATGVPIHEYHLRSRLAEARRLLAETPLAIKEIAAGLGYSDVFYFTRQFSQKTGVSPAVYRASVQVSAGRPADPESA